MTIPSAPDRLYNFVGTVFPTGTLVPFTKCFMLTHGGQLTVQACLCNVRHVGVMERCFWIQLFNCQSFNV